MKNITDNIHEYFSTHLGMKIFKDLKNPSDRNLWNNAYIKLKTPLDIQLDTQLGALIWLDDQEIILL